MDRDLPKGRAGAKSGAPIKYPNATSSFVNPTAVKDSYKFKETNEQPSKDPMRCFPCTLPLLQPVVKDTIGAYR